VNVLETDNLSKFYGDVVALNDVTLDVPEGLTGLLGPNGAGKTTLLHLITGQLEPSQGRLRVLGEDPWRNPNLRKRVGFVPETLSLWDHMTGRDHVELATDLSRAKPSRIQETLDRVDLAEDAERSVAGYSRGMRQRLKLAMALVHEPELLVLDEPFAGLDPVGRRSMMDLLHKLGDQGRSVLFSSHVLHEVQTLTRNIVVLVGGHVVAVGDVHEIRSLMDQHPHQVRVTVDQPRKLAQRLIGHEDVVEIGVDDDTNQLQAKTRDPEYFYDRLQRVLLDDGYEVTQLTSPDDNIQAVFEYLTQEDRS
jgi:ABC-2 type transport system ATP-binding protein